MSSLVPLTVAVPLLAAAVLGAFGQHIPARVDNMIAGLVAAAVTVVAVLLIFKSSHGVIDYWFGGWHPRHGIALGVSFHVEPLAAGTAAVAGTLMTAALVFSFGYFEDAVPPYFHVLMLVFLAAMVGFALSGDLFNMFVFFELMSICGFGLASYRIEQPSVLQGAITFGVTNTIAAFMIMIGIALLYGRTGALNLQQVGESLRHEQPNGVVVVGFAMIAVGFLIKAGAVPFHFWLSDAYAVAPAPVGVVFSGVMCDLGVHAVARVHWDVFSGTLDSHGAASVRGVLLTVGVATALLGGVMAFLQAGLKRMLAFVTVSHIGIGVIGVGLLTPRGLGGASVYMAADGLVRGSLFLVAGYIAYRLRTTNELDLRGRGRRLPVAGVVFCVGGLATAALPPFGPFLSKALVMQSAAGLGFVWLEPVLILACLIPAAALLRAFGRIFLGLGAKDDPLLVEPPRGEQEGEDDEGPNRPSALMLLPALALLIAGVGLAFAPRIANLAVQHAALIEHPQAVAAETLRGVRPPPEAVPTLHVSAASLLYGVVSVLGALALAALGLYRERLRLPVVPLLGPVVAGLKTVHHGVIGEYVAWLAFGTAAIGTALALLIR